jgi:hypothetical protein
MERAGYGNKVVITGSPLLNKLKGVVRKDYKEKVILFLPVITSHEEPDNLDIFYELKKLEYTYAQEKLRKNKSVLKEEWHAWSLDPTCATENQIPYRIISEDFYLVSKLTQVHDKSLYHGEKLLSAQVNIRHIDYCIEAMSKVSCVVGLEEGTFQLMCAYLGVPCVIVDGFKYGEYGGVKDYSTEIIKTDACRWTSFENIREAIETEIKTDKTKERREVILDEFGDPDSDPVQNIIDTAQELCGGSIEKEIKDGSIYSVR